MRKLRARNYNTFFEAIGAIKQAIEIGRQIKEFLDNRRDDTSFRVSLRETDMAYQQAHNWLMELIPQDTARRITAMTSKYGLRILYDAKETVEIEIDGHKVDVYIESPQPPTSDGGLAVSGTVVKSMVFRCKDAAGVEAVKNLLNRLYEESRSRKALLYTPGSWDNWNSRGIANRRHLDSIVLRKGLMEYLVDDLDRFINAEERYVDLGIPFHRGYLFYGPPGTGKTSIARSLAARVGGDVYALSLNAIKDNNDLNQKIGDITIQEGACAALVLEDIDVVRSTHSRSESDSDDGGGITLDGLLNVLDGMFTPNGLVVFMTTNDKSKFDDALIRPGRVDVEIEIDYLDDEQFERLCERFMPGVTDLPRVDPEMKITAADVVGVFKEYIDRPHEAYDKVVNYILEKGYADDYVH